MLQVRKHVFSPIKKHQEGQILLIVVLVMVVALTVGLSLASRSITNLKSSSEEANSQKAFTAAEAGIERALKSGFTTSAPIQNDSNSNIDQVTIKDINNAQIVLNNGNSVPQDDGIDIWLSDYATDLNNMYKNPWAGKTINIYWGAKTGCNDAALEMILFTGTRLNPKIVRYAVDPCQARATTQNHFTYINSGGSLLGKQFNFVTQITLNASPLILRIIPLYAGTPIGVAGYDNVGALLAFPSQGKLYTSIGSSGSTQRKVSFFQGYESIPSEYFYSLFGQ